MLEDFQLYFRSVLAKLMKYKHGAVNVPDNKYSKNERKRDE